MLLLLWIKWLSVTAVAASLSGLAKSNDVEQRWTEGNREIFKSDRLLFSTENCPLQHWPSPDLDSQARVHTHLSYSLQQTKGSRHWGALETLKLWLFCWKRLPVLQRFSSRESQTAHILDKKAETLLTFFQTWKVLFKLAEGRSLMGC